MTENQVKEILRKEVKETIEQGNSAFPNYAIDFNKINFRFTLRGTTAGKAGKKNGRLTLWLHPKLAKRDIDDYVQQTIKHEIAHLYQRKMYPRSQPHGRQFRFICRQLGDDGSRTHSLNTKGLKQERALKRFIYTCSKCGKEFGLTQGKHKKHRQSRKYGRDGYRCGDCYGLLDFTFEIREYSNITGKVMQTYNVYSELV